MTSTSTSLSTTSKSTPSLPQQQHTHAPRSSPRRRSLPTTLSDFANIVRKIRRRSLRLEPTIECSSGPAPLTHPCFVSDAKLEKGDTEVLQIEQFTCADAVDVAMLLRAVRSTLLERVKVYRADCLVDESWTCKIRGPKSGVYRVLVEYRAHPALTGRQDPKRPVALHMARGVPGLMTILQRA